MDDSLTFLFIPHLMFYNWQILRQSLLFMRNVVFGTYFLALLGGVTITIGGGAAISLLPPAQSLWGGVVKGRPDNSLGMDNSPGSTCQSHPLKDDIRPQPHHRNTGVAFCDASKPLPKWEQFGHNRRALFIALF